MKKGNQHYTDKQFERVVNEPQRDAGWGRQPVERGTVKSFRARVVELGAERDEARAEVARLCAGQSTTRMLLSCGFE